jgi:hypothetical protein
MAARLLKRRNEGGATTPAEGVGTGRPRHRAPAYRVGSGAHALPRRGSRRHSHLNPTADAANVTGWPVQKSPIHSGEPIPGPGECAAASMGRLGQSGAAPSRPRASGRFLSEDETLRFAEGFCVGGTGLEPVIPSLSNWGSLHASRPALSGTRTPLRHGASSTLRSGAVVQQSDRNDDFFGRQTPDPDKKAGSVSSKYHYLQAVSCAREDSNLRPAD